MSVLSVIFLISIRCGASHRIRVSWYYSKPSNPRCQKPRDRPKYLRRSKNRGGKSHSSYHHQILRRFTEIIQWQSICVLYLPKNVPFPLLVERPLEFCCTWCKWIQVSEMQEEVQAHLSIDPAYWKFRLQLGLFTTNSRPFRGLNCSFLPSHFFINVLGAFR